MAEETRNLTEGELRAAGFRTDLEILQEGLPPVTRQLEAQGESALCRELLELADALEGLVRQAEISDETEEQTQDRLDKLGAMGQQLQNREGLETLLRSAAAQAGGASPTLRAAAQRAAETILRLREKLAALRQQRRQKRRFQEGQAVARMQAQEMAAALQTGYALGSASKAADKAPPAAAEEALKGAPEAPQAAPVPEKAAPAPVLEAPAPEPRKEPKPLRHQEERLAVLLAGKLRENPALFAGIYPPERQPGPNFADDREAEAHFRAVHDLKRRMVNLELHLKGIGDAAAAGQPVFPLVRGAAREIREFRRDLAAAKQARPGLAEEYDRIFGGCAALFDQELPHRGGPVWDQYRAEKRIHSTLGKLNPPRAAAGWGDYVNNCTGDGVVPRRERECLALAMVAKQLEAAGQAFDPQLAERNAARLLVSPAFRSMAEDPEFVKRCLTQNKLAQAFTAIRARGGAPQPELVPGLQPQPLQAEGPVLVLRREDNNE
ncbi:MAG: hypothetical protein IKS05_04630 [Oscillospiraceae bacterium]|nr:hypothetical protein [Oscillospiraceae bacterium]